MKKALALAALVLLPLLPGADALGSQPQPWSPYTAVSEVAAIAMAREGPTIAAALRAPTTPTATPGTVSPPSVPGLPCAASAPNTICTDLAILDFGNGWVRNASTLAQVPPGRTHVAVSRDGSAIATWGRDGSPSEGATLRLHYFRSNTANWTTAPYERSISIPGTSTPLGLTLSDDGRRLVALSSEGANYVLRGYVFSSSSLDSAFTTTAAGVARALAASGDASRIIVTGQFAEGNFTYGGAQLYPFGTGASAATFLDRTANNTDMPGAAVSRAGDVIAIGGANGTAWLFRNADLALNTSITLGTAPVGNVSLSDDGRRLAAAAGLTLAVLDTESTSLLWNATVSGQVVTGLAVNRTGALIVVSTGGTGGAVAAFDESDKAPLWTIPGDARGVAIDADGTRIAYAQRALVGAAQLPRALTVELAAGGKLAPTREVTVPGTVSFDITLRNDGAAAERVVFEDSAPELSVSTNPAVIVVRPGEPVRVNLTVSADAAFSGPRVFNVTARAISSGIVDNVTLSLAPKPTLDVTLFLDQTSVLAEPGRVSEVLLKVYNNGTSDADVAIRATQTVSAGDLWDLVVDQTSLTALRGTQSTVKASVTPPAGVANGTSSTVVFTLEGTDIFDTARVTFRVNPDLKVEVNATGVTKYIEPGKNGRYNVTVTNTGSLPRQFDVFYTITEASGRSWAVDMQSETVRLDPLQKRVFPVTIIAPADSQPNERVSVLVTARSIPEQVNESAVLDNVTLFGVAVPLQITTTTTPSNGIPFAAPAAIILLSFLAAGLRRRRSS